MKDSNREMIAWGALLRALGACLETSRALFDTCFALKLWHFHAFLFKNRCKAASRPATLDRKGL